MNYAIVSTIALVTKISLIYIPFCIISYGIGLIPTNFIKFNDMQLAMSLYQTITLSLAEFSNISFAVKYQKLSNYERL